MYHNYDLNSSGALCNAAMFVVDGIDNVATKHTLDRGRWGVFWIESGRCAITASRLPSRAFTCQPTYSINRDMEPFSDPQAVARYAEGTPRMVPGFAGFHGVSLFYAAFTFRGWVAYA